MKNYPLTDAEIAVEISGPNSPYMVIWSAKFSGKELIITYLPTPLIIGGIGEVLVIQFINVQAYKSQHEMPISSPSIYTFSFGPKDASSTSKSASKGASYTFIFTVLIF